MASIYDVFRFAAEGVEKTPWRYKLYGGVLAGTAYQGMAGDPDVPLEERLVKGATLGGIFGLGSGALLRGTGRIAQGGEAIIKSTARNRFNKFRTLSKTINPETKEAFGSMHAFRKTFFKPLPLALTGAVVGASIAPEGHRMQGAMYGAGAGVLGRVAYKSYKGFEAVGNSSTYKVVSSVPGVKTAALVGVAAVPVAAGALFGEREMAEGAQGTFGQGGSIDYMPLSGNMADRMAAMNATGDLVLGLNGRRHG